VPAPAKRSGAAAAGREGGRSNGGRALTVSSMVFPPYTCPTSSFLVSGLIDGGAASDPACDAVASTRTACARGRTATRWMRRGGRARALPC
jgi:hypothetical protein